MKAILSFLGFLINFMAEFKNHHVKFKTYIIVYNLLPNMCLSHDTLQSKNEG